MTGMVDLWKYLMVFSLLVFSMVLLHSLNGVISFVQVKTETVEGILTAWSYRSRNPTEDYRGETRGPFVSYNLEESWNTSTLVFIHIQKTGGTTFGDHLVRHLDLSYPCHCKDYNNVKMDSCKCVTDQNRHWLFSRFSTGWPCGVHPGWEDLTSDDCVTKALDRLEYTRKQRRYFYLTILREPVARTVSEWHQVTRDEQWPQQHLKCGASRQTLDHCAKNNWNQITLSDFLNCTENPAWNRQVRMLADPSRYGCSHTDERMLDTAKRRLRTMAFFGLMEYQAETSALFERTFGVNFTDSFTERLNTAPAPSVDGDITESDVHRIRQLNSLDIKLYQYAEELFLGRILKRFGQSRKTMNLQIQEV